MAAAILADMQEIAALDITATMAIRVMVHAEVWPTATLADVTTSIITILAAITTPIPSTAATSVVSAIAAVPASEVPTPEVALVVASAAEEASAVVAEAVPVAVVSAVADNTP